MSASQEFFALERPDAEFEHRLRQAIFFGRTGPQCPTRLDRETQAAIDRIAGEFPNVQFETVLAAHQEFEWELDGTHGKILAARTVEILNQLGYTVSDRCRSR